MKCNLSKTSTHGKSKRESLEEIKMDASTPDDDAASMADGKALPGRRKAGGKADRGHEGKRSQTN